MSQISPAIRVLLVVVLAFIAAWFTVLKPSDEVVPTAAPVVKGAAAAPGEFKAKAQAGAATAEADALGAANAGIEETTPSAPGVVAQSAPAPSATVTRAQAATQAAATAAPLSAEAIAKLPSDVRKGLEQRKIVVLGVLDAAGKPWAPTSDDDRLVRNALRDVNRYGGRVVVEPVAIGRLARYDGIPEALGVTQSPTIVVIDRNRRAVALEGYADRVTINQAIADARRESTVRLIRDAYLAKVNDSCEQYGMRFDRLSYPTVRGGEKRAIGRLFRLASKRRASVSRIAAPARWRGLKAQILTALDRDVAKGRAILATIRRGDRAGFRRAVAADTATFAALDRRVNAVGLTACANNRTR